MQDLMDTMDEISDDVTVEMFPQVCRVCLCETSLRYIHEQFCEDVSAVDIFNVCTNLEVT